MTTKSLDEVQKQEQTLQLTKAKIWFYRIATVLSLLVLLQGFYLRYEQAEINHRLDEKDAYFTKGLIDGFRDREAALYRQRERNMQILEHCKANPCNLPPELSIMIAQPQFESIDRILIK